VLLELDDAGFDEREEGQLLGALEMLFGTPAAPGYLLTADWYDDDFDPNNPLPEDQGGTGSVSDAQWKSIRAGNAARFKDVIKAIEDGEYSSVQALLDGMPRSKSLSKEWEYYYYVPEPEEGAEDEGDGSRVFDEELKDECIGYFEDYYPKLRESAELYRLQCMHCHGNEGGADGPTSRFLDPLPRDYRRGIFKYTALKDKARPRREDLFNTLAEGIYSTAMPNFRRFTDAELHGLVDYVQLLAMRGETEVLIAASMETDEVLTTEMVLENYADVFERWSGQDEMLIVFHGEIPEATKERIERGQALFNDANRGNCFSCHGAEGRGDGVAAWQPATDENGDPLVDENGDALKSAWTGRPQLVPVYLDDWGNSIVPRDLSQGVFRFGRRPIDIYRRIYAGINGTPMPAIGESKDANGDPLLSDDDMWCLVHFVRSLSEDETGAGLLPHSMVHVTEASADPDEHDVDPPADHDSESTH